MLDVRGAAGADALGFLTSMFFHGGWLPSGPMHPFPRVLALGLSEATSSRVADPEFAAQLPCLMHMARNGASGITVAPQPLVSETLWASVVTGRSPEGHGLRSAVHRDRDGTVRLLTARDLAAPPVWRILEDAGLATGTFNLKLTHSPEAVSGFMVARDALPVFHPGLMHPPALYPPLRERFGSWTMTTMARTREDWHSALIAEEIETRTDVLVELLRTRPWSFALAQLPEVSRAQHRLWNDPEALRAVYAAADRRIARILGAVGPDTMVFVFSECGAGPIRHGVQVNAWLEREGYLQRCRGRVKRLASQIALHCIRAYAAMRRMAPSVVSGWTEVHLSAVKSRTRAALTTTDVDWSRTRAISPASSGEIILNASEHERRALADELRTRLLGLRDPEGRRVVEDVIVGCDPDLTIVWDDDAYMPAERLDERNRIFIEWDPEGTGWSFSGSHRREGILLVNGPGIERVELGRVPTIDLVPTWLELLGVAVPREIEGLSFAPRLVSRRRAAV